MLCVVNFSLTTKLLLQNEITIFLILSYTHIWYNTVFCRNVYTLYRLHWILLILQSDTLLYKLSFNIYMYLFIYANDLWEKLKYLQIQIMWVVVKMLHVKNKELYKNKEQRLKKYNQENAYSYCLLKINVDINLQKDITLLIVNKYKESYIMNKHWKF